MVDSKPRLMWESKPDNPQFNPMLLIFQNEEHYQDACQRCRSIKPFDASPSVARGCVINSGSITKTCRSCSKCTFSQPTQHMFPESLVQMYQGLVPTPSGRRTPFSILWCSYDSIVYKEFHGTSDLGLEGSHERGYLFFFPFTNLKSDKIYAAVSLANICSNAIEAMDVHNIKINIIAFYHRGISSSRTTQLRYS